jgi:hypothetical protein
VAAAAGSAAVVVREAYTEFVTELVSSWIEFVSECLEASEGRMGGADARPLEGNRLKAWPCARTPVPHSVMQSAASGCVREVERE